MTAGRSNIITDNKDWNTPPSILDLVYAFFGEIDLDPCSNEYSLVESKTKFIYPEKDGLSEEWNFSKIFVNPPYGRVEQKYSSGNLRKSSIFDWIKKAAETNKKFDSEVILLIPVATNTKAWKEIIFKKSSGICFIGDSRLKFFRNGSVDAKGAPMACSIVYFGNDFKSFKKVFSIRGAVLKVEKERNKK